MDKIQHFEGYNERVSRIFLSKEDDTSSTGWRRIEIDFCKILGVNRCSAHPKGKCIICLPGGEAITIDIGYKTFVKIMQRMQCISFKMSEIHRFEGYDERLSTIFLSKEDECSSHHGRLMYSLNFCDVLGGMRCSAYPKNRSTMTTSSDGEITMDIGYKTFGKIMRRLRNAR